MPQFDTVRLTIEQKDYETFDYYTQLREAMLEAYTGIVTGLKSTEKSA
jgi:importin subunit beta-1